MLQFWLIWAALWLISSSNVYSCSGKRTPGRVLRQLEMQEEEEEEEEEEEATEATEATEGQGEAEQEASVVRRRRQQLRTQVSQTAGRFTPTAYAARDLNGRRKSTHRGRLPFRKCVLADPQNC
jgi:hypothetical protein